MGNNLSTLPGTLSSTAGDDGSASVGDEEGSLETQWSYRDNSASDDSELEDDTQLLQLSKQAQDNYNLFVAMEEDQLANEPERNLVVAKELSTTPMKWGKHV